MDLKKFLPKILRIDFWEDFVDSISLELNNVKTEIAKKLNYWDIDNITDVDELLEISKTLGYTPDLSLDSNLNRLRRELRSIIFRIKNKTNYESYYFNFSNIPYLGNVYNLFHDDTRFLRSIDMSTTITKLDIHDLTTPFITVEPDFHYWAFDRISISFGLDKDILETLDATPDLLVLDQNVIRISSTHLAIEYAIDRVLTEDSIEYLMTPEYLDYLRNSVNYTRKASVIPHVGSQIAFLMGVTGYYDINDTENTGYTISEIKTKCAVTPFFTSGVTGTYMVVGTGSKSFPSEDYPTLNTNLLAYYAFDEEDDLNTDIYDDVAESNEGTINGTFTRGRGIIGKAINFNGISTNVEIDSFTITNTDKSYCFWINGTDALQTETQPRLLFQVNYIDLYIEDGSLKLGLGDSTTPFATLSATFTLDGDDHFIVFEIDKTNNLGKLYIDNVLKDSTNITGLGSIANNEDLYIGSKNNVYFFKGIIDEVRIYNEIKTTIEKTYLYTEQIGSLRKIDNLFYKDSLSDEEIYTTSIWDIIHSCVPSNFIKGEKLEEGDGTTEIFTGTLNNSLLIKNFVEISYTSDAIAYTITDNGKGILSGTGATGTINYTTGYYSIIFYKDIEITDELIDSGAINSIDQFLSHNIISPTTFILDYWFEGTNYTVTDDGAGNLTGTGITVATISYTTGELDITFSSATDVGKNIICDYTYEENTTPDNNSNILVNYQIIEINPTEAGLYNASDNMIAYATFPPIKVSDYNNHTAFQFFIKKT